MGKRQKAKGGQQNYTAQTPGTPVTSSSSIPSAIPDVHDLHSDTVLSPLETPQTSPGTVTAVELPSTEDSTPKQKYHQQVHPEKLLSPGITVDDISSKEIVAVANVFSNMKKALASVTTAFDKLGDQIETLETQSLDTKASGQVDISIYCPSARFLTWSY